MKSEEELRPVVRQAIREGYRLIGVYFEEEYELWKKKDASAVYLPSFVCRKWDILFFLLDSATVYRNEQVLGRVLEEIFQDPSFGVKREDVFLTSKLCEC